MGSLIGWVAVVSLAIASPCTFGQGDAGARSGEQFGVEVVRARAGSGQQEIGAEVPQEAMAQGPVSFVVAPTGEIMVLDQINARIQVFQGGIWRRSISLSGSAYRDGRTYDDIDLMKDGGFVLLDPVVEKVVVTDATGIKLHEIPLKGRGIANTWEVRGVQVRHDGIWVEIEDEPERMVRIGDVDGRPVAKRDVVRGILLRQGVGEVRVDYEGLDTGVAELTALDAGGDVLIRTRIFMQTRPEEVKHWLRVMRDGTAYQLAVDDRGVVVRRYDP